MMALASGRSFSERRPLKCMVLKSGITAAAKAGGIQTGFVHRMANAFSSCPTGERGREPLRYAISRAEIANICPTEPLEMIGER